MLMKGRPLWSAPLPAAALCLQPVDVKRCGLQLTAVGLDDGRVLIFVAHERESALAMHRAFQHDLYLLRLSTARAYVAATINAPANPVSTSGADEPIKLSAQILLITFACDDKPYSSSDMRRRGGRRKRKRCHMSSNITLIKGGKPMVCGNSGRGDCRLFWLGCPGPPAYLFKNPG